MKRSLRLDFFLHLASASLVLIAIVLALTYQSIRFLLHINGLESGAAIGAIVLLIVLITLLLILFYALFLSRMLAINLKILNAKIARLDESFLKPIDTASFPSEFKDVAGSINHLIARIQNFVGSQRELFIGIAHELKTPLAVMKAKNEVTLLRPRDAARYQEALRTSNESINAMNAMISAILLMGRGESAQFEEATRVDMHDFLQSRCKDYALIANGRMKLIQEQPKGLSLILQPTLLAQILQNFVENALKFSPKEEPVIVRSFVDEHGFFTVEVLDNGPGFGPKLEDASELFLPFKRQDSSCGAGLGLFLASRAAGVLKAQIGLENRKDEKGARAYLRIFTGKGP